jgi:hypothetical protein
LLRNLGRLDGDRPFPAGAGGSFDPDEFDPR